MQNQRGFTIVEVLVVVVVILILSTGLGFLGRNIFLTTAQARDSERASDMYSVSQILEGYYRDNPTVGGPTYPTTTQINSSLSSIIKDKELLTAPTADDLSFTAAINKNVQNPSEVQYIYQPLTIDNELCVSTSCTRYVLYYYNELDQVVKKLESRHQQ